jgi:hypothetical protein
MIIKIRRSETAEIGEAAMELYLEQRKDNVVDLKGVDARGEVWYIASITLMGIHLAGAIPTETGWPLNESYQLRQY